MSGEAHRGIEAAKWLAFAFMLGDHINTFLLGDRFPVLYLLGRLVFPMFALALGFGLAGRGPAVLRDTIKRLLFWACVAQLPWSAFSHAWALNVVFTLGFGAVIYEAIFVRGWNLWRGFLVVAAGFLVFASEFGLPGLLVVVASLWFAEDRRRVPSVWPFVALVLAVVSLVAVNGTFFAVLSLPLFWAIYSEVGVPRVRHVFYGAYAAQFVLLAFLRWWL